MKFKPHKFQAAAINHAVDFLRTAPMGAKQLYASPTGTGKSVVELLVQQQLGPECYIITPRDEIVSGMLEKLGQTDAEACGIWTPIKLRNRLLDGRIRHPKYMIFDETHHHEASSWQELDLLSGICPSIGYTASPYRGSPKSTVEFRKTWGDPIWLIDYPEAIACGYIKMPSMDILPLVDDDIIEVSGGEFNVESLEGATVDRIGDLVDHAKQWYKDGQWDKATIFAMPGTMACEQLLNQLLAAGLPAAIVNANTSRSERPTIFAATEQRILALIHINVVQEGVDLRLERLVDMAPTLSPVKWVQQIGRIMRPTVAAPEYICIAEGTPVLTDSGWKAIQDIELRDRVWDGAAFVAHSGVVCNGERECIERCGVSMTPDHLVLSEKGWIEACQLDYTNAPNLGTYTANGQLLLEAMGTNGYANAHADYGNQLVNRHSSKNAQRSVDSALVDATTQQNTLNLQQSCRMKYSDYGAFASERCTYDVLQMQVITNEVSKSAKNGQMLSPYCDISSRFQVGTIQNLQLIASTTTVTTNQAIYDLQQGQSKCTTRERVYDILDAGPHNRFQAGPLIVHNCTNRNILRHAYILEGVVPEAVVLKTEQFFGPTKRAHTRVLGLEALGRFTHTTTKLLSGLNLYVYKLQAMVSATTAMEFCCLVHPMRDPIWTMKIKTANADGTKDWGTWQICEPPTTLKGFASKGAKEPSEKQIKWWQRSAARFGLDPDQTINRRTFEALPVLNDIGARI